MKTLRFVPLTLALGLAFAVLGVAAQQPSAMAPSGRSVKYNLLGESVGLVSYDPVSYFPEGGGRPQRGLIQHAFTFDGVTYRFASIENLNRFKAEPQRYVPAYGGWCAWAVGQLGKRVDVDPESYLIRNGRLLVFYRDRELDTRALWLKNEAELSKKAEANWPGLSK